MHASISHPSFALLLFCTYLLKSFHQLCRWNYINWLTPLSIEPWLPRKWAVQAPGVRDTRTVSVLFNRKHAEGDFF